MAIDFSLCFLLFFFVVNLFLEIVNLILISFGVSISVTYGPTSPCVQRGRFAVIPEEPSSSPSVNDANSSNGKNRRTPSPDWDFTTEVKKKEFHFQHIV